MIFLGHILAELLAKKTLLAATDRKKYWLSLFTPPARSQQDYGARLRKVNLIAQSC